MATAAPREPCATTRSGVKVLAMRRNDQPVRGSSGLAGLTDAKHGRPMLERAGEPTPSEPHREHLGAFRFQRPVIVQRHRL